ncbi:mechanosensitive ion channel family protein [Lacticaseibacillus zhaodongensis]|uniref:mechanosensitive ion channel family protein n=1 Tax=Lacticaseibacillus zhaodongensis TaxID=2668065 RepID=UPI0012D2EB27|nr:mechanosensitive ion channel family protein [Lacticaseibacillus zhaodongensis]
MQNSLSGIYAQVATSKHWLRFFQRINWQTLGDKIFSAAMQLLIVTVVFIILLRGGRYLVRRSFRHYKVRVGANGRVDTMAALSQNTLSYVLVFFYVYSALTIVGVPVGTLIAGAGIVGLAVGFGAQGFVSDLVNGFFIIMEGQLDVGDSVTIGEITGTVTAVGLRTTQIESSDGTLNYIPNRNITIVRNLSRNAMKITVDIPLANAGDTPQVETIVKDVNAHLADQANSLTAPPQLLGLSTAKLGLSYQVLLTTAPGAQLGMQRLYLTAYVDALSKAGIDLRTDMRNPQ